MLKARELFFVSRCRVIDKPAVLREARAVTRAVPRMLGGIIFQGAPEVRASRCGECQESDGCFKEIYCELWVQNTTRRREYVSVRITLPFY